MKPHFSLTDPVQFLALGFGSGLAPKAPGTFGTLAAIPVYLLMTGLSPFVYLLLTLVMAVVGIYICGYCAKAVNEHDHPAIVWDEIVGFLITMYLVPVSVLNIVLGFALFRFFDIVKPWPISYLDRYVKGGFGIMIDDVIAGIMALACLQLLLYFL
ncbi:phosphatidylglycerophosphatase A family protein [Thalassotalea atypica]|uniref:phosphatidylglycerophosphatase A family protein n=1 Tax=Thalassotalea atypica TaxID=2054316 RepID=UPI002572FD07|nr:phosphatidylglycerophosphatase A [Thalassotalea atypica]